MDPGLGAAHERERRKPGRQQRRERWERCVEAVGADEERRRCGGSRAMDEDDGGREEDEAIYI